MYSSSGSVSRSSIKRSISTPTRRSTRPGLPSGNTWSSITQSAPTPTWMGSRPIRSTSTACRNSWQPEQRPSTQRACAPVESQEQGCRCAAACLVSFSRHGEIYRSKVGLQSREQRSCPLPALIGVDEFPIGYSLADRSPAGSASASPTATRMR